MNNKHFLCTSPIAIITEIMRNIHFHPDYAYLYARYCFSNAVRVFVDVLKAFNLKTRGWIKLTGEWAPCSCNNNHDGCVDGDYFGKGKQSF